MSDNMVADTEQLSRHGAWYSGNRHVERTGGEIGWIGQRSGLEIHRQRM